MTAPEPIIRPITPADINAVARMEREIFASPWTRDNLEKDISASFSIFVVAEMGDVLVGYASAWNVQGEIQLNKIAVLPEHRRSGIGTLLYRGIIGILRGENPSKVILEVREQNEGARRFYEALGFRQTGFRKNYYRDDNAVLLDRDLV